MASHRRFVPSLKEVLRGAERRWLRPLLRRVRVPRSARSRSRGMPEEAEELLVALLRARRRQGNGGELPAVEGDLGALVHGLLAVPPPAAGRAGDTSVPTAGTLERAA